MKLGDSQYIDTNEIMHRTSVFQRFNYLWSTFHARREVINSNQIIRKPYRRHNDLDLAERIIEEYGIQKCFHLPRTLVNFYYDSYFEATKIIKTNG